MNYYIPRSLQFGRTKRLGIVLSLVLCIFIVDTITDAELMFAVFYIMVILISFQLLSRYSVIILSIVTVLLAILSFSLTSNGFSKANSVNLVICLIAIGIATYLSLKLVDNEAAIHESRAQLARNARLMSLGALTTSIAHEVNQPLGAIATSVSACQRWLDADPPNLAKARRSLDRIARDTNRASEIIARVRRLAQGKAPQNEWLNLNKPIEEAVSLARREIDRQDISLQVSLDGGLPLVLADQVQLQQVMANFLLNAIEAMRGTPRHARRLEISSRADAGTVVVAVADTGVGLPPDAPDRPFDAFWTTKEDGVGIGLAISRSIVEAHGGRIWATPNAGAGAGAVFQFSLPAKEG